MQDNPRSVPEDEIAPSFTPVGGVGSGLPNQGQRASGKRAIKVFMLAIITKVQRSNVSMAFRPKGSVAQTKATGHSKGAT